MINGVALLLNFLVLILCLYRHFLSLRHYFLYVFIYLGFYVAFNTIQVISRRVVGRAEETSTYSSSGFCTVNCRPTASNYQLSHLRPCRELNPGIRGGKRECYHSATVAPLFFLRKDYLDFSITDTTLKVSASLYWFNTSISHGVENYFPNL